jgi:hypothetical protein
MSTPESLSWDAEHTRITEALDGLMHATLDLDCAAPTCGLSIHVGDPIQLGAHGWCHPVCAAEYQAEVDAERRHDMDRERGL